MSTESSVNESNYSEESSSYSSIDEKESNFIIAFMKDAEEALLDVPDDELLTIAAQIDAEQNPKMKEFLFLTACQMMKNSAEDIKEHFKWLESGKCEAHEHQETYNKLVRLERTFNGLCYYQLFSDIKQLFIDALKTNEFSISWHESEKRFYYSSYPSNRYEYFLYINLYVDISVCFTLDANMKLINIHNDSSKGSQNAQIHGFNHIPVDLHLDISDKMKDSLKTLAENYKRMKEIYNEVIELYNTLLDDFDFFAEGETGASSYTPWMYYQKHKNEYAYVFKDNVITNESYIDGNEFSIKGPFGYIKIQVINDEHYRFYIKTYNELFEPFIITSTHKCDLEYNERRFIKIAIASIPLYGPYYEGLEHARKQIEVERLYHHLQEASVASAHLTKEIDEKKRRLNALSELIGLRKYNLEKLENELLAKTCERDALDEDCCRLRLYSQLNASEPEPMMIEERKAFEALPYIHKQYSVTRLCFNNFANAINKASNEIRKQNENYLDAVKVNKELLKYEKEEIEAKMKAREQELEKKQAQFDAECEAYELESTKWKSKQESKFAKFQERIDNYESVKESRDALRKENDKLRAQLKSMTAERDKYKTTVETMMQFRK